MIALLFIGLLGALAFVPRIAGHPWLQAAFGGAALALLVWLGTLAATKRVRGFEPVLRKNHYIQPVCHLSILVYWGWYWQPVYDAAWLILGQLLFVYAFDLLLSWTLNRKAWLGFGPIPIVFSTNLFLWFRDDWFFLQFALLATGMLGKALIQWERDGRRTHIFNPSAFALSVFSVGLIATGMHDLTWGPQIAYTQARPEHIYELIFVAGLIVMGFFSVTLMTFAAVATCWALSGLWFAFTGVYYFVDAAIPIAVFLGMHLLFTDPSTSPKTERGRVLFGAMYGASVFVLYWLFDVIGVPTFYDKLLPVPLMNLAVRAIDRRTAGGRLPSRGRNFVYMGVWTAFFGAMVLARAVGPRHPGLDPRFWEGACAEQRHGACRVMLAVRHNNCEDGLADDCEALGRLYAEGRLVEADLARAGAAFSAGCEKGAATACAELAAMSRDGRGVPRNAPMAAALYTLACQGGHGAACAPAAALFTSGEGGVPRDPRRAAGLLAAGCAAGDAAACARAGDDLERRCDAGDAPACTQLGERLLDPRNPAADRALASRLLHRACERGHALGCADLGRMRQLGDGIPHDPDGARVAFARACTLGFAPACAEAR